MSSFQHFGENPFQINKLGKEVLTKCIFISEEKSVWKAQNQTLASVYYSDIVLFYGATISTIVLLDAFRRQKRTLGPESETLQRWLSQRSAFRQVRCLTSNWICHVHTDPVVLLRAACVCDNSRVLGLMLLTRHGHHNRAHWCVFISSSAAWAICC